MQPDGAQVCVQWRSNIPILTDQRRLRGSATRARTAPRAATGRQARGARRCVPRFPARPARRILRVPAANPGAGGPPLLRRVMCRNARRPPARPPARLASLSPQRLPAKPSRPSCPRLTPPRRPCHPSLTSRLRTSFPSGCCRSRRASLKTCRRLTCCPRAWRSVIRVMSSTGRRASRSSHAAAA
jgi:hypothetical protein